MMLMNTKSVQESDEAMEGKRTQLENDLMSPPNTFGTSVNKKISNSSGTPLPQTSESVPSTPQTIMHTQLPGEVTHTPTNRSFTPQSQLSNPHSSMSAITPMASAVSQAKSSIKLQWKSVLSVCAECSMTPPTYMQDMAWSCGDTFSKNCVSTVSLGCELKLLDIYCRTRYSEYNPARFHGVVMKILEPRATALVFRSGKIVCTGARNEHDSYIAARKFARIIQKLGFPAKFLNFKIQNFIATADLRFPVRLEALQQAHGQFASYEPELFPGLVYRMIRPRVVLLIFVNGKLVITGGKTKQDIYEAVDIIHPILRSFKKN